MERSKQCLANDATDSTIAEANAEDGVDGDATESTPEEEMRLERVSELARAENVTKSMNYYIEDLLYQMLFQLLKN